MPACGHLRRPSTANATYPPGLGKSDVRYPKAVGTLAYMPGASSFPLGDAPGSYSLRPRSCTVSASTASQTGSGLPLLRLRLMIWPSGPCIIAAIVMMRARRGVAKFREMAGPPA